MRKMSYPTLSAASRIELPKEQLSMLLPATYVKSLMRRSLAQSKIGLRLQQLSKSRSSAVYQGQSAAHM